MSDVINDSAIRTLRTALNGLSMRQRATADNIANLNTPGYKAARVSFEDSLQRQLRDSVSLSSSTNAATRLANTTDEVDISVTRDTSTSMRADGNNVDLDNEMARLAETVINYNTVSELVSIKLSILKSVIGSR
ncbi:MAG: flagellar basal body rod protein FlgB [Anaerolineae bacterium]